MVRPISVAVLIGALAFAASPSEARTHATAPQPESAVAGDATRRRPTSRTGRRPVRAIVAAAAAAAARDRRRRERDRRCAGRSDVDGRPGRGLDRDQPLRQPPDLARRPRSRNRSRGTRCASSARRTSSGDLAERFRLLRLHAARLRDARHSPAAHGRCAILCRPADQRSVDRRRSRVLPNLRCPDRRTSASTWATASSSRVPATGCGSAG